MQLDVQLQISFPKSDQDHRLQLIKVNNAIFAIVHSSLESDGPIQLLCEDWSLILLAPIKSKSNVVISAVNLICLNEIESEEGVVSLHASNQLIKFGQIIKSKETITIAEGKESQFDQDMGAVLYHYKLFKNMVNKIWIATPESLAESQKDVITSLCTLAEKMEGSSENLNIQKVLSLWGISTS